MAETGVKRNKIRAKDVFESYFLKHHQAELLEILEEEDEHEHYPVIFNFLTFLEGHVEVAEALLSSPMKLLPVLDTALGIAVKKLYNESENKVHLIFKSNVHARITELPACPELYRHAMPRTSDVGRLLCISGTVVRTTGAKMLEYEKEFICPKCKYVFTVKADHDQYYHLNKPSRCPNPIDCYSYNFSVLGESSRLTHTKDYQEIKVQEHVQRLVKGSVPRSLWATLEDDLVGSCKPGDDILLCGTVRQRWRPVYKDAKLDVDLVFKANNVTVKNKQRSRTAVTDEMREEFDQFWEQYKYDPLAGRNIILASFCPQVYGLYVVKLAVSLIVAGGVQKNEVSGTRVRGESHILLVGDPGTGKSQFLKYVCKLVPRCILTTGVGTTSAGLTVAAVREDGEWALEAGALVLADGGICCIDEFNGIREPDRVCIHEAMEQQTISVAKAGIVCKLNSRCSVIAATNPKGKYDPEESLILNVALASPLLSRFDLILVLLDTKNTDWDRLVTGYILEGRNYLRSDGGGREDWSLAKLQAYFCEIRSIQPTMTPMANKVLAKYYQLQRQTDQRSQARTTVRLLESLVRLSQGHARLMMRPVVTLQDAIVAVTLMEVSMNGMSLLTDVNPLHTSFPESPRTEYKNQAKIILQKLGLFDLLSEEMNRLNEEDRLLVNWPRSHPKDPPTVGTSVEKPSTSNAKFMTKISGNFRPTLPDDQVPPDIEELRETVRGRSRHGNQRVMDEYSKKMDESIVGPDLDVSFGTLMKTSNCGRKGKGTKTKNRKRKAQDLDELNTDLTKESQVKKTRKKRGDSFLGSVHQLSDEENQARECQDEEKHSSANQLMSHDISAKDDDVVEESDDDFDDVITNKRKPSSRANNHKQLIDCVKSGGKAKIPTKQKAEKRNEISTNTVEPQPHSAIATAACNLVNGLDGANGDSSFVEEVKKTKSPECNLQSQFKPQTSVGDDEDFFAMSESQVSVQDIDRAGEELLGEIDDFFDERPDPSPVIPKSKLTTLKLIEKHKTNTNCELREPASSSEDCQPRKKKDVISNKGEYSENSKYHQEYSSSKSENSVTSCFEADCDESNKVQSTSKRSTLNIALLKKFSFSGRGKDCIDSLHTKKEKLNNENQIRSEENEKISSNCDVKNSVGENILKDNNETANVIRNLNNKETKAVKPSQTISNKLRRFAFSPESTENKSDSMVTENKGKEEKVASIQLKSRDKTTSPNESSGIQKTLSTQRTSSFSLPFKRTKFLSSQGSSSSQSPVSFVGATVSEDDDIDDIDFELDL